ncbi:MAG: nicotinate (nicotinamide) nucleotide adenylyltransferase [Oscillospiraceae bacterium]
MGKTVIFGGTFNPPHIGHIEMLKAVSKLPDVDEIWLMPAKNPPHKNTEGELASELDRLEMCRIAAKTDPKGSASDFEYKRDGKSYTFDTLRNLKNIYPNKQFCWLVGADMLITFDKWYKYREILKMAEIIAVFRKSCDKHDFEDAAIKLNGKINCVQANITEVSSSEIREKISGNEPVSTLLDEEIYCYIKEHKLYGF